MYEQRRPDVAVFIDFENVYVSVRDKLNANPNFEAIMDRCGDLGRVVISRAYADWYRYPRITSALYANAIEPVYVATYYYDKDMGRTGRAIKNSVDMNLCIDAMKTLFTNPNISRFVLVTGDRDFIPLVNSIRQHGKEVYVIGIGGAASTHLAQSADEFVFYEQLVGKTPVGSAAATAIASRATELNRHAESTDAHAESSVESSSSESSASEPNIYDVLVEAIHLVRKRGYVSTLGSIKLVMKELMGGDFKESRYRDLNGRPFTKFKDFVADAEKRGIVQIFTNGTVNEVFLPGEDPYKLSQFASALSEEVPVEPVADPTVTVNGRKEPPKTTVTTVVTEPPPTPTPAPAPATSGRRRRRRSRRNQSVPVAAETKETTEAAFDEPDYTPPLDADELQAVQADLSPSTALEPLAATDFDRSVVAADVAMPNGGDPATTYPVAEPHETTVATDVSDVLPTEPAPVVGGESPVAEALAVTSQPEPDTHSEASAIVLVGEESPLSPTASAPSGVEESTVADAGETEEASEAVVFSEEEWAIFRTMMASFTKPVSFQQIFDTLREWRKQHNLNRTNEQLRSMIKHAINTGMLERSGRGKRVYYTLKTE